MSATETTEVARASIKRGERGLGVSLLGVLFSKVSVVMVSQILTIFWSRPWSCCEEVLDTGRRDHRHGSAPVPTIVTSNERRRSERANEASVCLLGFVDECLASFDSEQRTCVSSSEVTKAPSDTARAPGGHVSRSASALLASSQPCKAASVSHLRASSRS